MSQGFRLHILNPLQNPFPGELRQFRPKMIYDKMISDWLQGYDLTKAFFTIEADQIQVFRRADWSFILTEEVCWQLVYKFRFFRLVTLESMVCSLSGVVFVLSLGNHQIAGFFSFRGSARGYFLPVIDVEQVGQQLILHLRPHTGCWAGWKPDSVAEQRLGLDMDEVEEFFRSQDKLVE